MADKFLNLTAVQTIKTWATGLFAKDADLDTLSARVDEIVAEGGEPNVIESVKVNGVALTPVNKAVDVTVPTKTSDLTNDSNFQSDTEVGTAITTALANGSDPYLTDSEVEAKIKSEVSGAYKPQGSVAFANLPALSANIEGYVYNITDAFTTTADFVEGAGHNHPAGTNIVCVEHGTGVYKWDCLAGVVDLSAYWTSVSGEANTLEAATVAEINAILNA